MSACPTPRKVAHATKKAALDHLWSLRRNGRTIDCHEYLCACGAWHVGRKAKRKPRRVRR